MSPNDLQSLAGKFEQSMKVRNLKEKTIKEKLRNLRTFFEYLAQRNITTIDGITRGLLSDYQVALYQRINYRGRPNSIACQNIMLCAVKQFGRFLKDQGFLVADPARDIPYAKEPKRLPTGILTPAEAKKILRAPDTKSVLGYRDRTILEVLYSTAMRKSEVGSLTLDDVDYTDGFLRVKGKGDNERVVPLGRIACRYLENYIKSVRPELIKDPYNRYLFLSSRGNKMTHNVVWVMVKKYARKAKIKKKVTTHTMRHTCATHMLKNKADIRVIQELLGHSSLDSTQVYTHITINDLKEIHKRCHPREKDKE